MPAQSIRRVDDVGIFSHIYNRGVDGRAIFKDEEDYAVFLGFLKDYLEEPEHPSALKKEFQIRGRTFHGTPHQPNNFAGKVELVAYRLKPDHYHLILHQKSQGAIKEFVKSLCTRYSIYFNKKYKRRGTLFEGPYKSFQVKDGLPLLYLTRHLHRFGGYSSYAEYLSPKVGSLWVHPEAVLTPLPGGFEEYRKIVEDHELDAEEEKLIAGIAPEEVVHEEAAPDKSPAKEEKVTRLENNIADTGDPENTQATPGQTESRPPPRRWELLGMFAVIFFLLVNLGVKNIQASSHERVFSESEERGLSLLRAKFHEVIARLPGNGNKLQAHLRAVAPSPAPEVLSSASEATPEADLAREEAKRTVKVVILDGSDSVNIREKPTVNSEKIGKANQGDTFEFVSLEDGWYEIKLNDDLLGFISSKYIKR